MRIRRTLFQSVFRIVSDVTELRRFPSLQLTQNCSSATKLDVLKIPKECEQDWSEEALKKAKLASFTTKEFRSLERFSKHADTQFLRTFEFLKTLGFSDRESGQVFRLYPRLVARSLENVPERIADLKEVMNIDIHDIKRAVLSYPAVLFKTRQQIQNLKDSLIGSGFDDQQVTRIFTRFPVVSGLDMDRKLTDLHDLLVKKYCVLEEDYIKMLSTQSRMLGHSLSNIADKLEYFESLGLTKEEVGKLFKRGAALFGVNIETGYKTRVAWLESIGIQGELLRVLILKEPSALVYSVAKLERGYHRLKDWKLTDKEIIKIYTSSSRILGLNLDSPLQRAKAKFFTENLGCEVGEILRRAPTAFFVSLTRRYLVRYEYLTSIGITDFKLSAFLVTDEMFCRLYTKKSLDHYIQFYNEWQDTKAKHLLHELEQKQNKESSLFNT